MTQSHPTFVTTRWFSLTLALLLAMMVSTARAEDSEASKEHARVVLREGNAFLQAGHASEALAKFEEAHRLFPSPKVYYNLGQAHGLIPGHEAQAYEAMSRFLKEASTADSVLRIAAEEHCRKLRSKVGLISVIADPPDAELLIDQVSLGSRFTESPVIVGIGLHGLALRKGVLVSKTNTVKIVGGEALQVGLKVPSQIPQPTTPLPPRSLAAARPPQAASLYRKPVVSETGRVSQPPLGMLDSRIAAESADSHWTARQTVGTGLVGLGVASLVLGVVEHVRYFAKGNDFKNAGCGTDNLLLGMRCGELNDEFNSAKTLWVAGYVGAAVFGGAGAYLLLLAPASRSDSEEIASGAFWSTGMALNFHRKF
jgi:hypothetical protein